MSSTFSYHGEWPSDTFSLEGLNRVVDTHFGKKCSLVKITQGGYHKIYDILEKAEDGQPGESLRAVARVASPAFPRDKLLSEVATMQYIASYTSIPVPAVYEWCADASNEVGAEYMIMEKIPGTPAFNGWRDGGLTFNVKLNIITQVAEYIAELFNLRFDSAGSLYFSSPDLLGRNTIEGSSSHTDRESYCVGPIVSTSFYRAVDGEPDYPSTELHKPGSGAHDGLHQLRGPFRRTSDFLSHQLRACLYKCERFPVETVREELGVECDDSREISLVTNKAQSALSKAIEFVELYPGDAPVCRVSDPNRPFTFWLEDFRLVNVMIDETTGKVNALLDFEGAVLVPTWRAARPPQWIPDPNGPAANWYGGTPAEQRRLWEAFNSTVNRHAPEWREAYEKGKAFRIVAEQSEMHWKVWARQDMVQWADEGIQWVKADPAHAGVPMPEVDPLAYLDESDSPSL